MLWPHRDIVIMNSRIYSPDGQQLSTKDLCETL